MIEQLDQLREAELAVLNLYRSLHGVPALILNESLNNASQTHAEYLYEAQEQPLNNSEGAQNGEYGENIFWNLGIPDFTYEAGSATSDWYNENVDYNYGTGESISENVPVKHFTAEIWKSVTSVGFGFYGGPEEYMGLKGTGFYVVANFYPPPNVEGEFVENIPEPA